MEEDDNLQGGSVGKPEITSDQQVPFSVLCGMFEAIVKETAKARKTRMFAKFFQEVYHSNDYFPVLRLILPHLDKERQSYGMKESKIALYIVHSLNIDKNGEGGKRLVHWKKPQADTPGGDFAMAVEQVLRDRCTSKDLRLHNINKVLDSLTTADKKEDILKALKWVLTRCDAMEMKWLVRIILKDLKIGFTERSALKYFHADALEWLNVSSSLKHVCDLLADPTKRPSKKDTITLFHPVKPMLAGKQAPSDVPRVMDHTPFVVETKFDGERVQIHKEKGKNGKIMMFSRNSNDITDIYGPKLIPVIREHTISNASLIIDGELVVWDTRAERHADFGSLKTVAKDDRDPALQDKHLCFIAFDLIYCKEEGLMGQTLRQRMHLLDRVLSKKTPHRFEIVEQRPASTAADVAEELDQAIVNREEGIMIKRLDSKYGPNERQNNWLKIKPEYIDGCGDDLDLLILGGYWGTGRRGGEVTHFMLGVKAPKTTQSSTSAPYWSFCKVGSGYSDSELKTLQTSLRPHLRLYKKSSPPSCFELAPGFKEMPDVYIQPEKSILLQVKCAQIVPSVKFRVGYTLRFPRVERIRNKRDKNASDCMRFEDVHELLLRFEGRYGRRGFGETTGKVASRKNKRKAAALQKGPRGMVKHMQDTDVSEVVPVDELLKGMEICVMNGGDSDLTSKMALETLICEHGGKKVQNPSQKTSMIIAVTIDLRVKYYIKDGQHDIVQHTWLLDSIRLKKGRQLPLAPKYMIHSTKATEMKYLETVDCFGDDYCKDLGVAGLQSVFDQVDKSLPNLAPASSEVIHSIEQKYFADGGLGGGGRGGERPWWGLFRGLLVYVDQFAVIGDSRTLVPASELELVKRELEFHGARIAGDLTPDITHVVVDDERYFSSLDEGDGYDSNDDDDDDDDDVNQHSSDRSKRRRIRRRHGGNAVPSSALGSSFVVRLREDRTSRIDTIQKRVTSMMKEDPGRRPVVVVEADWVGECLRRGRLVSPPPVRV